MRKNDKFFIVNKRFWDKWLDYTSSESNFWAFKLL
jgi:hypothetical protein